jgi:hypothetical protein
MSDGQPQHDGSTTLAAAAQAQSREGGEAAAPLQFAPAAPPAHGPEADGLGTRFRVAGSVARHAAKPFVRAADEPLYRPLNVLTSDPAASRLEGSVALLNVPYEHLRPGPEGRLFKVDNTDPQQETRYRQADLDEPAALLRGGFAPSPSEPRFHQQMVYAVCSSVYATFRSALGRHVAWGFTRKDDHARLVLKPFAFKGTNAYYDKDQGALCFGYDLAPSFNCGSRTLPGGYVFTCLSHDVVAHELTHALLDGMRSHFSVPSGPDVAAFHEGFADLVAIFQRLSYRELVTTAIRKSRGQLQQAPLLTDLAKQLGHIKGQKSALRSALSQDPPLQYDECAEPHLLGGVLVCAVFEAYLTIFNRKTAPLLRLASNGTGVPPPGELPPDLVDMLAHTASSLASHFLSLIIRAVDYCPPVSIRLGEYLRALITADHDLVPDDPWAYREALIDAFSRRNIYPRHVPTLAEDALLWRPTRRAMAPITALDFGHLAFAGDPACAADARELMRQARVLGEYATRPEHLHEFGLLSQIAAQALGARAELPEVQSIRSTRRIGPDGQIVFDLVAEITQVLTTRASADAPAYQLIGGSTVILGPDGDVRYVISKSAVGCDRLRRRREFMDSPQGQQFWRIAGERYVQKAPLFSMLHDHGDELAAH